MVLAAVVPFSLSNLIAYQTSSSSIKEQVIELNHNAMNMITDNLKRYFHELNQLSVSFYVDPQLMSYLRGSFSSPLQTLYINDKINALYIQRRELHAVRYESDLNHQAYFAADAGNSFIEPLMQSDHAANSEPYEVKKMGSKNILVIHKQYIDYPSTTKLGTLSMYVGLNEMNKLIQSQLAAEEAYFLVIGNDQLLYASDGSTSFAPISSQIETKEMSGSFAGQLHGKSGVFIYVQDEYKELPFTLLKFVPSSVINQSAYKTLNKSLLIQIASIAFVCLLALILSYVIILPLRRLIRQMVRVEHGHFDITQETPRTDELGMLENRFYMMVRRLDDLMNTEYRNRLELSIAQLKMLQAQINPHFLNNTLQSIGTMAMARGAEDINDRIAELGAIMRYSMDLKTEVVTLGTELQHIERYMSLQLGRFKNRLSFSMSCPEDAYSIQIPKMILQPLIENSIVHGIEKGRGFGSIALTLEWVGDSSDRILAIRVIDNGKGIGPDTEKLIREEYEEARLYYGHEHGIGLRNVLQRFRLFYTSGFTWEIHSIPYETTLISLIIHLNDGEGGTLDESTDRR